MIRWLVRDGERVLQQRVKVAEISEDCGGGDWVEWKDIPTVKEEPKAVMVTRPRLQEVLTAAWRRLERQASECGIDDLVDAAAKELGLDDPA